MTMHARCMAAIAAVVLAAALAGPAQADEATRSPEAWHAAGLADCEDGRYADALAAFTRAADAGHLRSQEMAGLMNLLGTRRYGTAVPEDRAAAQRWFDRAANQGSDMAVFMARRLGPALALERRP